MLLVVVLYISLPYCSYMNLLWLNQVKRFIYKLPCSNDHSSNSVQTMRLVTYSQYRLLVRVIKEHEQNRTWHGA